MATGYENIARASSGQSVFGLPQNFGFSDLAQYEDYMRRLNSGEIQKKLAARRAQLSQSLNKQGQDLFNLQNPQILEDLNARGLLGSETARNQAQANALKEIALSNDKYLNEFDTNATGIDIGNDQQSLEAALDLRRSELENSLAEQQANREQEFAQSLASQQRRQGLSESLIGLGGQLGGAYIGAKALGGIGGTGVGGTLGSAGSAGIGGIGGTGSATGIGATGSAGMGLLGSGLALGGAGAGASALSRAVQKMAVPKLGQTFGNAASVLANPIGAQINAAKKVISNPGQAVSKAASNVGKSIKKAFCFDGLTPVEMKDGSYKPICELDLDEETKGGAVESIRIAKTSDGTMFKYKDVITTGYHAVKEGDQWVRVKDSLFGEAIPGDDTVYSIVTSGHRVYSNGIEFADEHEVDEYENLTIDQCLEQLNHQELAGVN